MKGVFEETKIGTMKLRNRFVRSATGLSLAEDDGAITPALIDAMKELADGGVGLAITGMAFISQEDQNSPGQIGVNSDRLLPGLTAMTKAVHEVGGQIAVQLAHAGLMANPQVTGQEPIGPSPTVGEDGPVGHEMTEADIRRVVGAFADAADRAARAGFDTVQIHAAHGWLLSQFLSPCFNRREDGYGGSVENRARIVAEVVDAVRDRVGSRLPVMAKLNSEDLMDGGAGVDDMVETAGILEDHGIDAIEISGGTVQAFYAGDVESCFSPTQKTGTYYLDAAKKFRARVRTPLILVGGIRSLDQCEQLVNDNIVDYLAMSRPLTREPGLIRRWESGDTGDAQCISDNACVVELMKGRGYHCPHIGEE